MKLNKHNRGNENPDINEAQLIWLALNQAGWLDNDPADQDNPHGQILANSMRVRAMKFPSGVLFGRVN